MGKVDERAFKTMVILISASICILVIGCVCIFILTNGVSKEMKLRAELISHLDARRKAEASSNYKSQFLANMSHELRTPMAAVIGLLDILICDDCLTNEQYSTITQIRKCSNALLRLLNNILDLSKVESGKLVLEEAEFDLGRELEGLVDMFSVQCINHNVETVLDLADDMPKLVQGDSARVVQIFANLISNSIKFTTSGYIILRGWCEDQNNFSRTQKFQSKLKETWSSPKLKFKQHGNHAKRSCKKDKKVILWFEVDDTGCGIDPSKWESVFESFEQADPSTTRLHGGTGLGLCIVQTLVNKMGGEIKVVKKNGPGTLMQLYLVLSTPIDGTGQLCQPQLAEHHLTVMLALSGRMGRTIMSQWLRKNEVLTWEASEWNELTQMLREHFQEPSNGELNMHNSTNSAFVIVIEIMILDLSTDIWKEQLNFLEKYHEEVVFAWILNHDTSNTIKMELRKKGHLIMINRPLYKAKMVQILEAAIKERNLKLQKKMDHSRSVDFEANVHECLEIDPVQFDAYSSDDCDKPEMENYGEKERECLAKPTLAHNWPVNNCFVGPNQVYREEDDINKKDQSETKATSYLTGNVPKELGGLSTSKTLNGKKSLEGLCILLAEDTPVLQRVATIMLEKMGARVVAVGDGLQAVNALKLMLSADNCTRGSPLEDANAIKIWDSQPYDLILMDCQMPNMDGYEATRAIRKSESGSRSHIPIVALTAHAMSSDEAKCLEVGMDAYLTKPIDSKLMVSTILSLTKRTT